MMVTSMGDFSVSVELILCFSVRLVQQQLPAIVRTFHEFDQIRDGNVIFQQQTAECIDTARWTGIRKASEKFPSKNAEFSIDVKLAVIEHAFTLQFSLKTA